MLTEEQILFFNENGYLVISNFWNDTQVAKLRASIEAIVDSFDLNSPHASVFSTKEQIRKADDYFLTSGREVRYFWEEKSYKNGEFLRPIKESINKIGHGLHDLVPEFEEVSYDKRIGNICVSLGLRVPLAVQSMYIFKQAFVGGEVGAHQDGAFLYTEPQTCLGFWWPLDDCYVTNGCLWAVPKSHLLGVHRRFRRRDPPNEGTEFVPLEVKPWDLSAAIPLETPKGSLVLIHSALVHFSNENTSAGARHAYSIHCVDGHSDVVYPKDNWLQRPPEYPFRVIPSD